MSVWVWASGPVVVESALVAGPEVTGDVAVRTWQTNQMHLCLHQSVQLHRVEAAASRPS